MDDFIILLKTKKECIVAKKKIEAFLKERLHLELNDKSRFYPYKMGVNFCGYRIFTTHRLLRTNSKKKIKKNVKKWNTAYSKGTLDIPHTIQSLNSWLGHSSHCQSYKLQQKVLNHCHFLYLDHSTYMNEQSEKQLITLMEEHSNSI